MRVLPYFQSTQLRRPSAAALRQNSETAPGRTNDPKFRPALAATAKDEFIPSGKLIGASQPARSDFRAGDIPAGEQKNNLKALPAQPATAPDEFIPSIQVSGVVHSIRTDPDLENNPSGVLKSGNYNFYKLNGFLEKPQVTIKGDKLDLKG